MMDTQFVLTLNEEQAYTVKRACELYARLHLGQLREVVDELLAYQLDNDLATRMNRIYAQTEELLLLLFPQPLELPVEGQDGPVNTAWDIYQVLRHRMAWARTPEGDDARAFEEPRRTGLHPLPECMAMKREGAD